MLVLFGLGSANVYYGASNPDEELPTLTGNSLLAALGLGLIGIIGIELIAFLPAFQEYMTNSNVSLGHIRLVILCLPLYLANNYLAEIVRARGYITRYNLLAIWNRLTSLIGLIVFVWVMEQGLTGAINAWGFSLILVFILTGWLALQAAENRVRINANSLRRNFSFGLRLYPGNIAQFLNYRLDRFLVAWYLNPVELGLYVTAASLSERLWEIPHSIRTVLLHRVAATDDKEAASTTTARVSRVVVVLVGALCLIVALLSHLIILALYGKEYLPAVPALIALMPGTWTLSIGKLLAIHLAGSGRPEVGTFGALTSLVGTIILDFLLIPRWGIIGASVASSLSYSLSTLVILIIFLRVTKLNLNDVILLKRSDILFLYRIISRAVHRRLKVMWIFKNVQ